MKKYPFKRERSEFWITIYENDDASYSILTSRKYIELINFFFPMFESASPTKWRDHDTYVILWLPEDRYDQNAVNGFINWCQDAAENVLWLYASKNISAYFADELDFCIAADFNYVYGNGRTEIGEAEYQMKYNTGNLSKMERERYEGFIITKMLNNCKYIPIADKSDWCVSPMPVMEGGKEKFAWLLAEEIANCLSISFINAKLTCMKPQMKQLSIEEKITVWEKIYCDGNVQIDKMISGKSVILIDDLYQSGTTIWQYARFLKKRGAKMVFGVVCVKSLKDSDNT